MSNNHCEAYHHFSTTTFLFNSTGTKTFLIKHKKLGFWFPPGGHVDDNEYYFEAALREIKEETGLDPDQIEFPSYLVEIKENCHQPIHIQRNEVTPNHFHYDLIFAGIINEDVKVVPGEGESLDFGWFELAGVRNLNTKENVIKYVEGFSKLIQNENIR